MGPVTRTLILANVGVFLLQAAFGDSMLVHFALWPIGPVHAAGLQAAAEFRVWQLFTSAFLHGSVLHLFLNMFALFMFGRDVERELGSRWYLRLYLAAVLSAAATQLLVVSTGPAALQQPSVGASGGVFGILLAFGMLFPRRTIVLLFPPIPMPARLFVVAYGLIELVNGVLGTAAGIAHFAHLGGMLGGYFVVRSWRRRRSHEAW